MKEGDYVLISARYLAKTEGFTTKGGKKKWYRVQISQVLEESFTFSREDMNYIHEIGFNQKELYKELGENQK